MSEFDFKVRHIKGKKNKVAEALSRKIHGLFEINISRAKINLEQRIRTVGINDGNYTKIMAEFQNSIANSDKPDISIEKKGLLRFKNKLFIRDSTKLKLTILDEEHKKPYYGHLGYKKAIIAL